MRDVLELVGVCLIVAGAALVSVPLALCLAGGVALLASLARPASSSSSEGYRHRDAGRANR